MQNDIDEIKKDIQVIKERNLRVEADKAWEMSLSRAFFVALATYIIVAVVLLAIGDAFPFRNALIATIAFILSTQSLPFLKRFWVLRYLKKPEDK